MCGIAAYVGPSEAFDFVSEALTKMEYRGYDSFGIVVVDDKVVHTQKATGAPSDNVLAVADGNIALGHTRWATHGPVDISNCHPVQYKTVHVVHNGIVLNATQHRARQKAEYGVEHQTDTDTEIIAVELYYKNLNGLGINSTNIDCLGDVGAFVAYIEGQAEEGLWVYRGSSPLYCRKGKIASDLQAFSGYEDEAYEIPSTTFLFVTADSFMEYSLGSIYSQVTEVPPIVADPSTIVHYMLKEIDEQRSSTSIISADAITWSKKKFPLRVKLVGCGSSYYAAMYATRQLTQRSSALDITVEYATDFTYRGVEDILVFISQSGETKDVLDAIKSIGSLERDGMRVPDVVVMQNKNKSSLSQAAPSHATVVNLNVGPEIGVAATKTFTATSLKLQEIFGRLEANSPLWHEIQEQIDKGLVGQITQELIDTISGYKNILILGCYWSYPLALEAALKFKEVSYIHAEAMRASEIKHGPIALIDPDTLCIVMGADRNEETRNNIYQIQARGGNVFDLGDNDLTAIIMLQRIAYYVALNKGINPDKPRHLAKAVTV